MILSPDQLSDLKSRPENDCGVVAKKLGAKLRKSGRRLIGSCPLCPTPSNSKYPDRFEIKEKGRAWVCRYCGGGDVIKLVMEHKRLDFRGAVDWLGGPRAVDPAEMAERERQEAEHKAAQDKSADEFRQRERKKLYDIWNNAKPAAGSPVERYLQLRGLTLPVWPGRADRLRCVPEMPYFHGQEEGPDGRKRERVIGRHPAMVAPIVGPDGKFRGLHFTYIDLGQASGKAKITDPDSGEELPAKKVRGSKSGGHIDLVGARVPEKIVIGEGIETVLSVWLALTSCGIDVTQTAFWSGVDLGNIGGAAADKITHPTLTTANGRAQRVPGLDPDLEKGGGIVLPASVADVVQLGDGDSDRTVTHCALYRGAQRWWAINDRVAVRLAWADEGMDFNDMVRE